MDRPRLLLPTFLYGPYGEVKKASRRAATQVAKGASLAELPTDWFDVADMKGYILVDVPDSRTSKEEHYHGHVLMAQLLHALDTRADDPRWPRIFDEIIANPWTIYGCQGPDSHHLFRDQPERAQRFAKVIKEHWDLLNTPGRRFLVGGPPAPFWIAAHNFRGCLVTIGAPQQEVVRDSFDASLRDGAMPPVVKRYVR